MLDDQAYRILVSAPFPLKLIRVFELGWTGFGLGLEGLVTKSLEPGLDKGEGLVKGFLKRAWLWWSQKLCCVHPHPTPCLTLPGENFFDDICGLGLVNISCVTKILFEHF